MNEDIYQSPEADLEDTPSEGNIVLMYSPTQVACAAICGPVALVYFLMANFKALEKEAEWRKTGWLGGVALLLLFITVPFLPESIGSTPFTVAYILLGRYIAMNFQMTKEEILASDQHNFHSNWRVFFGGIAGLVIALICLMGVIYLMTYMELL